MILKLRPEPGLPAACPVVLGSQAEIHCLRILSYI